MRTTLTLDDDVAAKLNAEARRTGRSFKEVVNAHLRLALNFKRAPTVPRFRVAARPLEPVEGVSFDNVEAVLDQIDGPGRR